MANHGEVHDVHHGVGSSSSVWNEASPIDGHYEEPDVGGYQHHHMDVMLNDALRYGESNVMDGPNVNATSFYKLLEATQQSLYEGCSNHSELYAAMRLLSIKLKHNMSNCCFDDFYTLSKRLHRLLTAFQKISML